MPNPMKNADSLYFTAVARRSLYSILPIRLSDNNQAGYTRSHTKLRTGDPVRSRIHIQSRDQLLVGWVTTSESWLLCGTILLHRQHSDSGRAQQQSASIKFSHRRTNGTVTMPPKFLLPERLGKEWVSRSKRCRRMRVRTRIFAILNRMWAARYSTPYFVVSWHQPFCYAGLFVLAPLPWPMLKEFSLVRHISKSVQTRRYGARVSRRWNRFWKT